MSQISIQQAFDLALQCHQSGRWQEARLLYRQILDQEPENIVVLHNLASLAQQMGHNDVAVELLQRLIALDPEVPEAHDTLGNALRGEGKLDQAVAAHRRAIELRPDYADAHNNLGNDLYFQGRFDDAIAEFRKAIELNPQFSKAYNNLGLALRAKDHLDVAIAATRQAIALEPNFPEAFNNLAGYLRDKGQLDESIAASRRAIALKPDLSGAHSNLGGTLKDQGDLDQAIAEFRQAIALDPRCGEAQSNLLFTMLYHPAYDARALAEEHRRWNRENAQPLGKFIPIHGNDRDPNRRLRIGYVSRDFVGHPVGVFLEPLLGNHDKTQVEVFAYSQVTAPDRITDLLRSYTDHWRSIVGLSDSQVADLIQQDQIDILVDLAMHTAGNRLLVFARKPAPVQVTYLAYCGSTGLETIDYRLSDPHLDPPGIDESIYSEKTIRLPRTYWCYQPKTIPADSSPLPALSRKSITFGSLNNFCKVNDQVLDAWAAILRETPGSQILLSAREGSHRDRVLERLERAGVERGRVLFSERIHRMEYFKLYDRIDIALDTFPYCGGTTTCDALWKGVPVVSLAGKTAVGRGGVSILSNVGVPEFVGDSPQQYVQIAVELARDLPRLKEYRASLRRQMLESPLMDAPAFTRNVEAAYRRMWYAWCEKGAATK